MVSRQFGTHRRTLPQADDAAARTRETLDQPLTAAAAVPVGNPQLTLLSNPALRGEMARLGCVAANVCNAGGLANALFPAAVDLAADVEARQLLTTFRRIAPINPELHHEQADPFQADMAFLKAAQVELLRRSSGDSGDTAWVTSETHVRGVLQGSRGGRAQHRDRAAAQDRTGLAHHASALILAGP